MSDNACHLRSCITQAGKYRVTIHPTITSRSEVTIQSALTTDLERSLKFKEDWLAEEDFPGLEAEAADLVLCQLHILAWPGALHWRQRNRPAGKQ